MSGTVARLLELSDAPAVIASADAIVVEANRVFSAMFEGPAACFKGRSLADVMGAPASELQAIIDRSCRTSSPVPFTISVQQGQKGMVRCRINGALLERGDTKRATTVLLRLTPHTAATSEFHKLNAEIIQLKREVLARQQAEASLRESETRFRLMADAAPVMIWMTGTDRECIYLNKRWLEFTGRSLEQELGNGWVEGVHPDDRERSWRTYVEAFDRREPFEMEFRLRRGDGTYGWILSRGVPRISPDGLLGYTGSCLDITDLKRTQQAMVESEQRLAGIISSAMDAIITIDEEQRITDFNNAAERMFGYAASEALRNPIDRFMPERFRAMHAHHIKAFGETQDTKRQMGALGTIYGRRRNGEEFPIEASISQLQTRSGKFYTVILRDVTERKRADEALRISESRYRELIHALPAAVYTCDAQGRITLYNQAAAVLWGREPVAGQDLWCGSWKIYRPDGTALPLDECPMAVTLRTGRPVRGEEILVERPDGTIRHVLPHPEPVTNESREVIGAINMLIDITDLKEAEKAAANLAAIVTSSDDAIVGKNLQGIVTTWNRAAERLFGYTAEEMIGQSITRIIPPRLHYEETVILEQLGRGEPIHHYETIRRRKDGREVNVSLSVSPVVDAHGRVIGASKIARDISDQKLAEEALRQSEARKRAIFESAMDCLITMDADGRVQDFNPAAERTFGYTREQAVGRTVAELIIPPRLREAHWQGLRRFLETGEGAVLGRRVEMPALRSDGTEIPIELAIRATRISDRAPFFTAYLRDISERKGAEEALLERDRALTAANAELSLHAAALAESNKELESFSYSVSHDLRAPLRTIDAFSGILMEEQGAHLAPEGQRCLNIIRKAAGQAGELIDDLLELSRLGRQSLQRQPVSMRDLAQEAADEVSSMGEGRTISLVIGDLPPAEGDRRLLKLVWNNLLVNAIKYTKYQREAAIEVGWMPDESQEDMAVFYVKDNGVGFDMKYVSKLFGVFQRLHRREEFEGTGVGLAIVHRVIQRHGGRVWAEGKVERGATFYFSIRKAGS